MFDFIPFWRDNPQKESTYENTGERRQVRRWEDPHFKKLWEEVYRTEKNYNSSTIVPEFIDDDGFNWQNFKKEIKRKPKKLSNFEMPIEPPSPKSDVEDNTAVYDSYDSDNSSSTFASSNEDSDITNLINLLAHGSNIEPKAK